jgi:hypothetical protein
MRALGLDATETDLIEMTLEECGDITVSATETTKPGKVYTPVRTEGLFEKYESLIAPLALEKPYSMS